MAYAWIIDTDHLADDENDEAGIAGPNNAPDHLFDKLANGDGITFEIYDDDDEIYYTGRLVSDAPPLSADGIEGDEPLRDFGTPNAGATEIRWPQYPELNCG